MSARLGARLTRTGLTALLLASCNALFGIEEGRPYPSDASTAGASGNAGSAGAGTGGGAGLDASDGSSDATSDAASDASDAASDASDAAGDACPLFDGCGATQRACWCTRCRSELEGCLKDQACRAAFGCIWRTDCVASNPTCQGYEATCPRYCTGISQQLFTAVELLQRLAECAQANPDCAACPYDRQCVQNCPIVEPAQGQALPTGCPPGGVECNYGRRHCVCNTGSWTCAG